RHNDEFLTPYNPASPIGAGAFDNAAKATTARNDFADLFARHFGDHLGESAARDLGRDYANTLTRNWNNPDLGQHLRQVLDNRLPPHLRDHLANVPVNLQKPLNDYFSTASAYAQQTGGSVGSGALEGYLGEGLGSLADGRGWEASVWSATAGASQAGIQQGATDGTLAATDLFSDKDKPNLTPPPPPRTESDSTDNRTDSPVGPDTANPWGYGNDGPGQGADRAPERDGDSSPAAASGDRAGERGGDGPRRGDDRDGGPAPSRQDDAPSRQDDGPSLYDRDGVPDVDDVPDLVSDTDSDTGSEFGDPDDPGRNSDDTVRVHDDGDTRTPFSDPLKTPENGKASFGAADTAYPGPNDGLLPPGTNDDPLIVNFLNAIVPDNQVTNAPPGAEQATPGPGNNADSGGPAPADRSVPPAEQHTPAPVAVAPPVGQAAPPPAAAPHNPASDSGQRSASSERDSGGRSPQRTNDNRTPDPSAQQSAHDDVRTAESTSQPDTAPAPAQRTTSEDVPPSTPPVAPTGSDQHDTDLSTESAPPPPPVTESGGGQHDTGPTSESGPPQDTEDTGRSPAERDAEQPDERDEDGDRKDDGAESVHGEGPAEEGDGQEQDGEEAHKDSPAEKGETSGADPSRNADGVPQDQERPRFRPEPLPEGETGPERNGAPSPPTMDPPATADSWETAAPPTENGGAPVPDAGGAPPAAEGTTPDTTGGPPAPTQSPNTDAPPAPPAARPDRAADSGSHTPGETRTDPADSGIDPRADARAASVLDRLPELTRALADNDIRGARALGADFWRLLRPVDGPAPENRSIREARTLAQALVYVVSDPSDRRVPLGDESVPPERVRDAEALARGIERHLRDRHDPTRARLWLPGGRLTTDYVRYAMQDPADRGPSPYDAPDTATTVNTALVGGDKDTSASEGRSGGTPTPVRTATGTDGPAASGSGTIRRLPTAAEADRYGDLLHDPGYNPHTFDALPTATQDSVLAYTRSPWLNRFARLRPLNEATVQAELDRIRDESRSHPGWQVYEIGGGRWPGLAQLEQAADQGGLSPEQERVVRGVLDSPDPQTALENLYDRSGSAGQIAESLALGGEPAHFPDSSEALAMIRRLDRATGRPFPEGFEAVHGMYEHRHLLGEDSTDPRALAGTTHVEQGYFSVSLGTVPSAAGGSPIDLMRLTVPEGTRGLWVGNRSEHPGEREMILARGTRYRITSVEPWGRGYLFHAEILPPAHDAAEPAAAVPAGTGEVLDRIDRALEADDAAAALAGIRGAAERFTADLTATVQSTDGPGRTAAIDRLEQLREAAEGLADRASAIADTAPEAVAAAVALAADLAAAAESVAARGAADAAAARDAVPDPPEVDPEAPDRITEAAQERDTALTRVSDAEAARDDAERASRIAYEAADTATRTARTTENGGGTRVGEARAAAETADTRRRAAIAAAEDAADRHENLTHAVNVAANIAVGIALNDVAASHGDAAATAAALDRARSIADLASPGSGARVRLNMRMNMMGLSAPVGSGDPVIFAVTDTVAEVRDPDGAGMSGADLDSLARGMGLTDTDDTEPAPVEASGPATGDDARTTAESAPPAPETATTGGATAGTESGPMPRTGDNGPRPEAPDDRPPASAPPSESPDDRGAASPLRAGDQDGTPPAVPAGPPPTAPPLGQDGPSAPEPAAANGRGNPSPRPASDRITTAIRLGELASASIKDAISGYQRAQGLVDQTREAERQGRPDADDLRARAHEAQREANEAYRNYDGLARMQADLLRPDGPTTVMTVLETPAGPSGDTGPVPLGGNSGDIRLGPLSTGSPAPRGESPTGDTPDPADRAPTDDRDDTGTGSGGDRDRSTPEGAPPEGAPPPRPLPPLAYDGGLVPDRNGQSYDLGYLTTSTLIGPHMLFAEHLPGFVDDVLARTPGMPDPVRREIADGVADILTREGPRPFLREGGHPVGATHDGRTWTVDIDLRPEDGDFYHVDAKPLSGGGDSRFLRLHDTGPGVDSSDGGSRGAGKTLGGKFTMSPFYMTGVNGNDAGPIAAVGGRGGAKVRGTSGSASTSANAASGLELLGAPNLYVGDLHMRASVTGPGLTAPRVQEGTAYNGLAMNLPGEVVSSSDAPARIVPDNGPTDANGHRPPVNRPFMGTGHPLEITRFSPVPPSPATASDGGGTTEDTGGDTAPGDGGTGRGDGRPGRGTLGTWLADHLLGPRPSGDRGSGHTPSRKERRTNEYRESIESTFDHDRLQQYLPQMSNSSAHIRIEIPGSRPRIMRMWSVSTEYDRKDFTLGLVDFVHSNTAVKSDSSSVKHSTVASGSVGGGFGIWLDLPNGKSVRLDVPFVEYSATFEKSTGVSLNTSGTSSHVVHAPSGYAAYDVKRDFYVHIQGEPGPHRFEGATVEMLTIEDARQLTGEPSKAPDPAGEPSKAPDPAGEPAAPPRPPFPNLAVDRPTDLSGATVRGFGHAPPTAPAGNGGTAGTTGNGNTGTTDTTGNNDTDGDTQAPPPPQLPFYDDLAYRVLKGISEKRPGLVIPDLARTGKDYAVRPSHMDGPVRSFRERWGLRRNVDVARENTLKVIKALSESGLKSGAPDLPGNGIPVRLKESALVDPTMVRKDRGGRPETVTVRVYGDFDRLVHQFDTTASGGGRFAGSAGITTTKGSSVNHALSLTTGASVRTDAGADARGVPRVLGNPSISLNASLNTGRGSSQGLSHSSEETVLFSGDSDVWTSRTRFTARMFEHDDIGMARDDRPQREHGTPLLGDGMDAQAFLLTPKMPPMASDSPNTVSDPAGTSRDGETAASSDGRETRDAPEAADTRGGDSTRTDTSGNTAPATTAPATTGGRQPLTPEQARDMIVRNFVPRTTPGGTAGDSRGGRWTVVRDGVVHTWGRLFGGGAEIVTPAQNTTADTATGTDGDQAAAPTPPPPPGGTTDTTTGTSPETAAPGGDRSGDGAPDNRPPQGPPTLNQIRAQAIRRIGGTFERVNTQFDTGSRGMRGLLEETYRTFSEPRSGLHDGYRRKLDSFLSQSSGGGRQFENHLSAEELATSRSSTAPSGSRIRQEMSGGLWSPHDVRATVATKVEIDTVTDFRPVDAQMRWNGGSEVTLSTTSSLTGSLGLKLGGSGGRNPNPHPSDDSLPSEAVRPIPLLGPSLSRTFFSRGTSHTQSTSFTSSVLFIPDNTKVYAFRASGHLTQAVEFLKNWSIGPPLNWKTLFHGWTAPVQNLVAGYVHSRDAQQEGLVMDRATRDESGTGVNLSPQPNPKTPDTAQVRPGFENNGRQIQPADPEAAIQALVNDLAGNGLELTSGGRELLLQKLTTHLAQNPDSTVPVPVKVRALGPEPTSDSRPHPMRSASPGKVYVNLTRDPSRTDVSYVGQSGYYIESHTWKPTDANAKTRGTGTAVGADGVLLQPLPYAQDDQGPDGQPEHRPLFASPAGAVSSSTNDGSSSGESQDDARTVELHLNTPYAKVGADTTLTLTLELGEPKGGENGNPPRSTYTGTAGSGRIETMYPFAYMTFDPPATTTTGDGTQGTGTDLPAPPPAVTTSTDGTGSTGTAPADRNTPPAPEGGTTGDRTGTDTTGNDRAPAPAEDGGTTRRPGAPVYASVSDALRTWTGDAGPRPGNDTAITKPAMVQDGGQALRDKANVVIAQSLGWQPPAGTPEGGQPTRATADAARAYLADAYGQDPVYNEIDHSLSDKAVKAVYPSASRNSEGVQFTDVNRTEWGAKVVPSSRRAKILDALPGSQLSDSRVRPRTNSAGDSHGGSRGRGGEFRPAGLTTGGISYDGHEGIYTGAPGVNTSSSHGAERGSNQAVKGYQESDQLRQGPVYLVEYDATWAFAAGSKLKAPAAFHPNDPSLAPTPFYSRPTRWGVGEVTVRMAGWFSESDAVAMGFLTPDQAKDLAPVMDRVNQAREEFSQAEAAYADTRAPLEGLAEKYAANPDDRSAESAYSAQEEKYTKALSDFDDQIDALIETVNDTRTTLGSTGQGADGGTTPPARTVSGDGSGGATRAPATGNTSNTTTTSTGNTGNTGAPPAPGGAPPVGTTATGDTTNGGSQQAAATTPPDPAPAPTGPRQELVDRFRAELNLRPPEPDTPDRDPGALDPDGSGDPRDGREQNTNTADARVERASDAADNAAREARDARDDANGLSTPLDRGRADLRNGTRILTGSGDGAPAAGAGGPATGTDGAPSPGAVRQTRDAREAADTAHDGATAVRDGFDTAREDALTRMPEPDRGAFDGRLGEATTAAGSAATAAADAWNTADRHEDTVTGLGNDLNATPSRYRELGTAVDGLSGQDRPVGGDRAARDARDQATNLISDLEGIADRADTAREAAETAATRAGTAKTDADTAREAAEQMAADAEILRAWAEDFSTSASGHRDGADRAAQNARDAGEAAQRAADAAEDARTAADAAADRAAEVRTGAAESARNAARAEADARAARTAADLAAQAAANASRPSPGGQTESDGTGPRGAADTREDDTRRGAEDARARAQEARQIAREAAERAARAAEDAKQLAERAQDLRTRANATAREAEKAAARADEARRIAEEARNAAGMTVEAANEVLAAARRAHRSAQQAAQRAAAAAERAAEAAETAQEARDDAEKIAESARKRAESVRKLLERILAAMKPERTSSEGGPPPGRNPSGRPSGGSDSTVPGRI
ncbi:hypothetical protein CQJ94_11595, partial [Glycomyces fuscus]